MKCSGAKYGTDLDVGLPTDLAEVLFLGIRGAFGMLDFDGLDEWEVAGADFACASAGLLRSCGGAFRFGGRAAVESPLSVPDDPSVGYALWGGRASRWLLPWKHDANNRANMAREAVSTAVML